MSLHSYIESYGTYLPPGTISSRQTVRDIQHKVWVPLQLVTGIRERRVTDQESSLDLAQKAVRKCLERSCFSAEDIDLVIACNISKLDASGVTFTLEPSFASEMCHIFDIHPLVAFDVSNACAGLFTGIYLANKMITQGSVCRALVFSGEHITPLSYAAQQEISTIFDDRLACLTLGDAGAAILLDGTEDAKIGFQYGVLHTLPEYSSLCKAMPTEHEHGGIIMHTASKVISQVGKSETVKSIIRATESGYIPLDSTTTVIPHQIAAGLPAEVGKILNHHFKSNLTHPAQFMDNVATVGNTASTSHIVALAKAISDHGVQRGQDVIFVVAASGLTVGLFHYTFDNLPEKISTLKSQGKVAKDPSRFSQPALKEVELGVSPRIAVRHISLSHGAVGSTVQRSARCISQCLTAAEVDLDDLDYVIDTSLCHSDGVAEPSQAALVAGHLGISSTKRKNPLLCFDLQNGALSWLQACQAAQALVDESIDGLRQTRVMLTASEVGRSEKIGRFETLNIAPWTSAALLEPSRGLEGFSHFHFRTFPQYNQLRRLSLMCTGPHTHYDLRVDPHYGEDLLACLEVTCLEEMGRLKLALKDFRFVILPMVSADFSAQAAERLGLADHQLVVLSHGEVDPFTNTVPAALDMCLSDQSWLSGEPSLILGAGSGIQIGMAIYIR